MFTRFVVLPGVKIDLPATDMRMQHDGEAVAILTIGANQTFFFNNGVYEPATIGRAFSDYIREMAGEKVALLVKIQSNMEMQAFLKFCELAQEAGFSQVQIVGQKRKEGPVGGDFSR